VTAIPDSDG
jgi:hypothetical protein